MTYVFEDFELDPAQATLRRGDETVPLEPQVFDLLALLVVHAGDLVTKDKIVETVWDGRAVSDSALTSRVKAARQALADDGRAQRLIKTVHGRGYRFVGEVREKRATPAAAVPSAGASRRPLLATVLGALLIAVTASLLTVLIRDNRPSPTAASPQADAAPAAIAVLPFVNMSRDPAQEAFADGITEAVLNNLAEGGALRVVGRTSTFAFKGKNEDLRTIGDVLGASLILEGSVRQQNDQVRITAKLIESATGYQVWSQEYDRELADIFVVQDEIAASVAAQLGAMIEPEAPWASSTRTQPEVYQRYLKAKALTRLRASDALSEAIGLYREAIGLDPHYALAHAGLAEAILLTWQYQRRDFDETLRAAGPHIERALALAPDHAEVLSPAANFASFSGALNQARAYGEKALAANPSLIDAYDYLGGLEVRASRPERALDFYRRGLEVSPLDPVLMSKAAMMMPTVGQSAEGLALARENVRWNPDNALSQFSLGRVAAALGHYEEAATALRASLQLNSEMISARNMLTLIYFDAGWFEEARAFDTLGRTNAFEALVAGDVERANALTAECESCRDVQYLAQDWPALEGWAVRIAEKFSTSDGAVSLSQYAPHAVKSLVALEALEHPAAEALRERWSVYAAQSKPSTDLVAWQLRSLATWHAYAGERDLAFAYLTALVEAGHAYAYLDIDPAFAGLQDDARLGPIRRQLAENASAIREALRPPTEMN